MKKYFLFLIFFMTCFVLNGCAEDKENKKDIIGIVQVTRNKEVRESISFIRDHLSKLQGVSQKNIKKDVLSIQQSINNIEMLFVNDGSVIQMREDLEKIQKIVNQVDLRTDDIYVKKYYIAISAEVQNIKRIYQNDLN